jgi:putative transposase
MALGALRHNSVGKGSRSIKKTVAHSMQEMGLAAVYAGPNLSKRARQAAIYPYLLAHTTASAPNHIWGIDITYIRLRASWMYAGFDPGLVLALRRKPGNWIKPCSRALSWRPCIVRWHKLTRRFAIAKRRSQFTSPQYTQLLLAHDVRISMDSTGRALDHIFTERMFRTIKYEEVYVKDYLSPREAREGLSQYLRLYNEERLHQSLDYRTPKEIYWQIR